MEFGPPQTPEDEPEMTCLYCENIISPNDEGCEYCEAWDAVAVMEDHIKTFIKEKLSE